MILFKIYFLRSPYQFRTFRFRDLIENELFKKLVLIVNIINKEFYVFKNKKTLIIIKKYSFLKLHVTAEVKLIWENLF